MKLILILFLLFIRWIECDAGRDKLPRLQFVEFFLVGILEFSGNYFRELNSFISFCL